ncbi:MAG: acetoin utilization protein AcuC, partial [Aquificae bacterium]|nr:acetoin utilization protein AcuC [Aquificota bacterium]
AYKRYPYPSNHPLRIPRVSLFLEFLKAMNLLGEEELVESRPAAEEELTLFHAPDYIKALKRAQERGRATPEERERYGIGTLENPVSPATFSGSALAAGSTLQALELYLKGYRAFNPAGGMHHALRAKARGFCFINDCALALEKLKKEGYERILYVDLDAHHADGLQETYYEDPSIFTLSLHQSPAYAYPFGSGFLEEVGRGKGRGLNMNVPLPKGTNDEEFLYLLETALSLVAERFRPQVYLLQLGTDALREDPLSKLSLTNEGFLRAVKTVRDFFGEGLYLGGGGYNPYALARAWTLLWCELSGREAPKKLTPQAKEVLLSVQYEDLEETPSYLLEELRDPPSGGGIRDEVKSLARELKSLWAELDRGHN